MAIADVCGMQSAEADGMWRLEEIISSVDGLQGLSLVRQRHVAHGSTAILANVGGPICSVDMSFATEASDNRGLVHCLEHLCFMGSGEYQKGYLDHLATRCGCDGANAATEPDHTSFSFEAAGEAGVLAILPVFVNHVLCPSLTEDAFVTEIHHVNGKGARQGVVFSEMLGRVTDEHEMLDLELRRATFGDESPYSYEHGGMPDLILKLTRDDIAAYHRKVYTTDNLTVIISGNFDQQKVLSVLGAALDLAAAQGARQRCEQRPFCEALPGLPASCPRRRLVSFPSDDVSVGTVAYSHRLGNIAFNDTTVLVALDVVGRFLAGLASSPLEQAFVQCEPPIASSVSCDIEATADPHFVIEFSGVPFRATPEERRAAKRLGGGNDDDDDEGDDEEEEEEDEEDDDEEEADAEKPAGSAGQGDARDDGDSADESPDWFSGNVLIERLVEELRKVHAAMLAGDKNTIGMLHRAIKKENVSRRVDFEDAPTEFITERLLPHTIFSKYPAAQAGDGQPSVLRCLTEEASALACLLEQTNGWWADLLEKQLLQPLADTCLGNEGGAAEVRACPSALLSLKNERQEDREQKKNAKSLGKKKLKALQERVDAAERANNAALSMTACESFPPPVTPECVPDFKWEMEVVESSDSAIEVLEVEVLSSFVELHVGWLLDDAVLPGRVGAELMAYLNLFTALVCETDVAGENYRSVVTRLDDELVSYSCSFSCNSELVNGGVQSCQVSLKLTAEQGRTSDLVAWMDRLAHDCEFPEERVLATCRRLLTGFKANMREGENLLAEVATTALYSASSPQVQFGALAQRPLLERCCNDLRGTCEALNKLRDALAAPNTACTAMISGNTPQSRSQTRDILQKVWWSRREARQPSMLKKVEWRPASSRSNLQPLLPFRYVVVGCAGTEAAIVHLRADLPLPPLAFDVKKSGSLRLLCEALSMMEGPLSKAVRGKGLAYDASINFLTKENAVTLALYECSNVRKALEAALGVLRGAIDEDMLTPFQLDNARGSLVFQLKGGRATPVNIVGAAMSAACRGWRSAAEVQEWEALSASSVKREDVLGAHIESLMQLCDASKIFACVVCDPGDCKKNAKALATGLGIDAKQVLVKENIADSYDFVHGRIRTALDQAYA